MIEYGVWAGGALIIGLGVLPVVAALAGLVRPKDEERTALRAFTALLLAALLCFGLYTAVKASYLSTSFGTVIVERNLIYVIPLVFVGTALWLERPRLRWLPWRRPPASSYLLVSANYALENVPYSDALGLAIAQMSNRNLSFTDTVQWALVVTLAISVLLLVLPAARRSPDGSASGGRRDSGARSRVDAHRTDLRREVLERLRRPHHAQLPKPLTWLDDISGGEPVVYLGQNINTGAALGIWLTEFWNRSLKHVWSLDGHGAGPGPVLTPVLLDTDGRPRPGRALRARRARCGRRRRPRRRRSRGAGSSTSSTGALAHADGVFDGRLDGRERVQPVRVAERPGREHGRAARPLGLGRADKPGRVLIRVGTPSRAPTSSPSVK